MAKRKKSKHKGKAKQKKVLIPEEVCSLVDQTPQNLLAQARLYWFYGDWQAILDIPQADIEKNQDSASLHLIKASAYQQESDFEKAEWFLRQALALGCETRSVAQVCIAGANNILGRIAVLQQDDKKAEQAFLAAVGIGEKKEIELIAHSRAVREIAKLGLLPQAAKLIDSKLKAIKEQPSSIKNIAAQTKVLETELELLSHELNISLQRNQLYQQLSIKDNEFLSLEVGSDDYIKALEKKSTSQLGQDIWVLQKTNFKRNGFFVEFGATDGVLLSNSYLLEKEFGWQGICAEPNQKFYEQLEQNRNCTVSNECIGVKTGEKVKFVFAQEYGGMQKHMADDMHADKRQAYLEQGKEKELETISLHDFLVQHNAPKRIDYLSIDTEGSEYEILKEFPFEEWDISFLTVEHNYTTLRETIFQLLSDNGYKRIESQWDDFYYKVKKSL